MAAEQLVEHHGIPISDETLRRWRKARGVEHCTRRTRPHRAWRARKAHGGDLVPLDGSHHDWFAGRGPRCVLRAFSDDASRRVWARLYEYEGTIPAEGRVTRSVMQQGIPLALSADKHTTDHSPAPAHRGRALAWVTPRCQFGRALEERGVELIAAPSPQAKGRVARRVKPVQEHLVNALRRAGFATIEAANRFVGSGCRSTIGASRSSQPRPPICIGRGRALDRILCLQTTRGLRKDFTIAQQGGSIRSTTPFGPSTCWGKTAWMGRCG